jgi:hypothetical protein
VPSEWVSGVVPTDEEAFGAAPRAPQDAVCAGPTAALLISAQMSATAISTPALAVGGVRSIPATAGSCGTVPRRSEENDADHQENQELQPANIENRRLDPAGDRAYLALLCDRWRWPPEQPGVSAHLAGASLLRITHTACLTRASGARLSPGEPFRTRQGRGEPDAISRTECWAAAAASSSPPRVPRRGPGRHG